jgi:uracil-DNA glycosylase
MGRAVTIHMNAELRHATHNVLEYLKILGIDCIPSSLTKTRKGVQTKTATPADASAAVIASVPALDSCDDKDASLKALRKKIGDCSLCSLSGRRTNIVFGEGSPEARIMFIGEAPGREEDLQARPFVGEAGRQLTSLIEKILGLHREDVYIANICKCRPPENRDPEPAEIDACFPFINSQIRIIKPAIIIALGKISTYSLMKPDYPISKFSILRERGKMFHYNGVPVMPTTHPAYWLRNREDKHRVVQDIQSALKNLGEDTE